MLNDGSMQTTLATSGNDALAEATGIMLVFLIGVFVISGLLSLLMYIVYGIGAFRIAKNEGYDKPWLAWIPYANMFMIPILVEYDVHERLKGKFTKVFGVLFLLAFGISITIGLVSPLMETMSIPMPIVLLILLFMLFIGFLPSFLLVYGFYFLADRYSERPVVHVIVLLVSFGASLPFQLFRFGNRESLY